MSVARHLARLSMGSLFVNGGIDVIRHPENRVKVAAPFLQQVRNAVPVPMPADDTLAVQLNAGVQVVAGVALASGRMPRLAALALAASMVPTTFAGHPYWTVADPQQRKMQKIHFDKNLAIFGGLLLAAVDTGGRPSLTWRARRAARHMPTVGH